MLLNSQLIILLGITIQLALLTNPTIPNEVKEICSIASDKFNGTLYRLNSSGSKTIQKESARLEINAIRSIGIYDNNMGNNNSANFVSKCNISDLNRLQVSIHGQPAPDQLMSMVKLLEQASATEILQFRGPLQVLKHLVTLRLIANITRLSAACTDRIVGNLNLIGDPSRVSRLATIQLYTCELTNNKEGLSSSLLSNLPKLVSAKFDRVKLIQLKTGHFIGLPSLRYLYLTGCDLTKLDAGSLDELKALLHLRISDNPELKQLPRNLFKDLTNLEKLDLPNNGLLDLSSVFKTGQLQRLSQLDLSGNDLRSLRMDTFEGLENLRALLLVGNRLLKLTSSDDLSPTPSLALCSLNSLKLLAFDGVEFKNKTGNAICSSLALNSRYDVRLMRMSARLPSTCSVGSGAAWCRRRLDIVQRRPLMNEELPLDDKLQPQQQQQQQQQQQNSPSVALLLIFGALCFAHLVITGILACVCWRMVDKRRGGQTRRNRRRQGQLTVTAGAASKKVNGCGESDCYEAVDGCSGGALMATSSSETGAAVAAPVLISFRARPGDEQMMDDFVVENQFPKREKTCYDFDEDA